MIKNQYINLREKFNNYKKFINNLFFITYL